MKSLLITLLVVLAPVVWLLFRPRLAVVKTRLGTAMRIVGPLYLAIIVVRLVTSPLSENQLELAGLSVAFFAGLWVVVWLITRSLASHE